MKNLNFLLTHTYKYTHVHTLSFLSTLMWSFLQKVIFRITNLTRNVLKRYFLERFLSVTSG